LAHDDDSLPRFNDKLTIVTPKEWRVVQLNDFTLELEDLDCGTSDFLRWRRTRCIGQWAIDDCRSIGSGVNPFDSLVSAGNDYAGTTRDALKCWTCVMDREGLHVANSLRSGLLTELRAMTEHEDSEPNLPRWIAQPWDSRTLAHVGTLYSQDWGFRCDCSAPRKHYSDRVRRGLLLCPVCLAHLSQGLDSGRAEIQTLSLQLLQQVGWKPGEPAPRIFRINQATNRYWNRKGDGGDRTR